jgi:DNA/RNA-binding domain of Phe-tRNA-synthetase-like protein
MEACMKFDIHESAKQSNGHLRLGYIIIRDAKVQGTPPSLTQKFAQLQTSIAAAYKIDGLADIQRLTGVPSLYNQNDFDMTRYSLDSEELVRRVLHNKEAYYMNSAVAVSNYCSIHFLLPVALYDLDHINGDIIYRVPLEESYVNMNGDIVGTDGKPFLSDGDGVFGNYTADTRRTAVTLSTSNLLAVVYGDERVTASELTHMLNFIGEMIICYNGGIVDRQVII